MWVAKHLHDLNFSEYLLQVLFIQLRLINYLYSNLAEEETKERLTQPHIRKSIFKHEHRTEDPAVLNAADKLNTLALPPRAWDLRAASRNPASWPQTAGEEASSPKSQRIFPQRVPCSERSAADGGGICSDSEPQRVRRAPDPAPKSKLLLTCSTCFRRVASARRNRSPRSGPPASLPSLAAAASPCRGSAVPDRRPGSCSASANRSEPDRPSPASHTAGKPLSGTEAWTHVSLGRGSEIRAGLDTGG